MGIRGTGLTNKDLILRAREAALRDPLVKEEAWESKIYHRVGVGLWKVTESFSLR